LGVRPIRKTREVPCKCTFRGVFRACLHRFQDCVARGAYASGVSLEFCRGRDGRRSYSRKQEEFMADFCLVAKRVLSASEDQVFRFHFLLGADWKLCCRRLDLDRGSFFHTVYRIEQKLGRVFAELEPYPLYPVAEYFSGVLRREPACAPRPPQRVGWFNVPLHLSA
jgi:hypothetical protein